MTYYLLMWWALWLQNAATPPSVDLQARRLHTCELTAQNASLRFDFSPDGTRFLVWGDKELRLYDTKSGKKIGQFNAKQIRDESDYPEGWWGRGVKLLPDGRTVVAFFAANGQVVIDLPTGKINRWISNACLLGLCEWSPDGKFVLASDSTMDTPGLAIFLWDFKNGKVLRRLRVLRDNGKEPDPTPATRLQLGDIWTTIAFSPDSKIAALGYDDHSVRIFDLSTGKQVRRFYHVKSHFWLNCLAFSPDSKHLAIGGGGKLGMAFIWDVATGKLIKKLGLPLSPPPSGFSETDFPGHFINRDTGEEISHRLPESYALAFSPDGKTLAAASAGRIYLWELATGQVRCRLAFNAGTLNFNQSGLLAAGGDSYGHIWDWRASLLTHKEPLSKDNLERLWSDLGSQDAHTGHRAVVALVAARDQAVSFLGKRLQPIETVAPGALNRLLEELDDRRYQVREQAMNRLKQLAELARPNLVVALKDKRSPEAKRSIEKLIAWIDNPARADRLRWLRATEILEYLADVGARQVLLRLSSGMPDAIETKDAIAVLKRLEKRK